MSIDIIEDAIDKKRREILDKGQIYEQPAQFSPTGLKGKAKPGRVYRAAYDDPRRVSELQAQGYKISKDEEMNVGERKADGRFTYKDTVLMDCDQAVYVERHARYRAAGDDFSQARREQARENMNRILRDEGRMTPHKDHTFDESVQGDEQVLQSLRQIKDKG